MNDSLRTAFILQIHNNPEQVNLFIQQLISEDQADVYVHIDKKSFHQLSGKILDHPNVKVLEQSIDCEWGDISQIDTALLLIKEVLASQKQYDYVCLRSGQDLLVREGFKDFLTENKGKIFIRLKDMSRESLGFMKMRFPKVTRKRYTSAHPFRVYRRMLIALYGKGINLSPNLNTWRKEYSFYKGSQWFTIPYDVAAYMIDFLEKNEWYYRYFKNTLVPDESFFHTLIMNSPYKDQVVSENLYFLEWGKQLKDRNSPQYLTMDEVSLIEESNQFFARKFDQTIDSEIIEYFTSNVVFGGRSTKITSERFR